MERAEIVADVEEAFGVVIPPEAVLETVGDLCGWVKDAVESSGRPMVAPVLPSVTHDTLLALATRLTKRKGVQVNPDSGIRELFPWRHQRIQFMQELGQGAGLDLVAEMPAVSSGLMFFFVIGVEVLLVVIFGRWFGAADIAEVVLLAGAAVGIGYAAVQLFNQLAGGFLRDVPPSVETLGEMELLLRNALCKAGRAEPNPTAITWGVRAVLSQWTNLPMSEITRDKKLAADLGIL